MDDSTHTGRLDETAVGADVPEDIYEQYQDLITGTVGVEPEHDLLHRLVEARKEGRPLRAKLGGDPTAPGGRSLAAACLLMEEYSFQR